MIVTMSIVGFLVLALVYFVIRAQSVEKELKRTKQQAKSLNTQAKQASTCANMLAIEMQRSLLEKLDAAHKRMLISGSDYTRARALFCRLDKVVQLYSEQSIPVSQALKTAFKGSDPSFNDVCQYITTMPTEVKLAWSRNDMHSFITACNHIIRSINSANMSTEVAIDDTLQVVNQ